MLCYIYCSFAVAYAKTLWSVKQERSTSQSSQVCVLRSVSFRVHSSKEAWQDRSPREHKSILCVLGIEKQLKTIYAELNSNPLMSYHGN